MKYVAFLCNQCHTELTDFLQEIEERELSLVLGQAVVPVGNYVRLSQSWTYREFLTERQPGNLYVSPDGDLVAFEAGDYLLNIADVHHQMAEGARYGDCGWHPRGAEVNAWCAQGHAIGTVHSDESWSAVVFRLIGRSVQEVVVA